MKILVIEDNPRLSQRIIKQLQRWYITDTASSGHAAIAKVGVESFDIILLDLGLPDMPGLDVCKHIRRMDIDTPIIVVTGVDDIPSRVELLNAGADDYVTKPFDLQELRARINAMSRRRAKIPPEQLLHIADLTLNPESRVVERAGKVISLRKKEFDILEFLLRNKGRVVTRHAIFNNAWSINSQGWSGSVDVHIKQLRDKIDKPFTKSLIQTSYGVGYKIDE